MESVDWRGSRAADLRDVPALPERLERPSDGPFLKACLGAQQRHRRITAPGGLVQVVRQHHPHKFRGRGRLDAFELVHHANAHWS